MSALFLHEDHFLVSSFRVAGLFLSIYSSIYACGWNNPICLSRLSLQMMYFPSLRFMSATPLLYIPWVLIALLVESLACCFHSYSMQKLCCQKLLYISPIIWISWQKHSWNAFFADWCCQPETHIPFNFTASELKLTFDAFHLVSLWYSLDTNKRILLWLENPRIFQCAKSSYQTFRTLAKSN